MIYFTSDLHLYHNMDFVFKPRGFDNIEDMSNIILENWNNVVTDNDDVYILGDLMLNDNEKAMNILKQLNGKIHIVLGNHDTSTRVELYKTLPNVVEITYATVIKYKKYHFYLSHYPTFTANLENGHLSECLINLYGHTHQRTNFYNDIPWMYHVGLDSHENQLVSLDQIIEDCKAKVQECKNQL